MFEKRELTDPFLRTVKASAGRRREVFDTGFEGTGSLCLRVSAATGKKVWTFVYRNLAGQQRRYRIGSYPGITLSQARRQVRELAAQVTLGGDPSEDRWKEKSQTRAATDFGELARRYLLDAKGRKAPGSLKNDERKLKKDLLPTWGKRDISNISRRDVVRVLESIVDRGAPITANRTRTLIQTIFKFAVKKGLLPLEATNPCQAVDIPGGKEKGRKRFLSENEIKSVWQALGDFDEPVATLFRLILLTGQRPGRSEVYDLERTEWRPVGNSGTKDEERGGTPGAAVRGGPGLPPGSPGTVDKLNLGVPFPDERRGILL